MLRAFDGKMVKTVSLKNRKLCPGKDVEQKKFIFPASKNTM